MAQNAKKKCSLPKNVSVTKWAMRAQCVREGIRARFFEGVLLLNQGTNWKDICCGCELKMKLLKIRINKRRISPQLTYAENENGQAIDETAGENGYGD